jgi:hypothetical protein
MKDFYAILGVSRTATPEEIKQAYRQLAWKYHPDRNMGSKAAEDIFKQATEAYSILSDEYKRSDYDFRYEKTHPKETVFYNESVKNQYRRPKASYRAEQIIYAEPEPQHSSKGIIFNCCILATVIVPMFFAVMITIVNSSKEADMQKSSMPSAITEGELNPPMRAVQPDQRLDYDEITKNKPKPKQQRLTPEERLLLAKKKLTDDGWEESVVRNGQMAGCYNISPVRSDIDNYLEIQVGSGTDVAIKVMSLPANSCIRYVFINGRSTYRIKNLPEGRHYLKIAYGRDWYSKVENGRCLGKFLRNALYEKGDDVLNFTIQEDLDGYSIPSYRLKLDVIHSDAMNSFNSHLISEAEFNE